MINLIRQLCVDESGQGMAEYGLILALVAVALIAGLMALQNGLSNTFSSVTNRL